MPDKNGNLYLFEAIELRNEYDRNIKLIEKLLEPENTQSQEMRFYRDIAGIEEKEAAADFDPKKLGENLKALKTKRIKLNQAIQMTNFDAEIDYNGENISLAEALEVRKNLIADIAAISKRVADSAYKRIIHKEGRDIVHEPRHSFLKTYNEFQNSLKTLRQLINQIHTANHKVAVRFKDE